MAKRFTDTDKWNKAWFRKLGSEGRDIWYYLTENCDAAGLWDIDLELMSFRLGFSVSLARVREVLGKHVVDLGDKLFIQDFIEFQYGRLSETCNPHQTIIRKLKKLFLWEGYLKGTCKGISTLEEQEQEQEQEKEGECEGKKELHPLAKIWNENCRGLRKVREVSPKRLKAIRARLAECPDLEIWRGIVKTIAISDWCNARHEKNKTWRADFDFLLQPDTRLKASEGKYDNAVNLHVVEA